MKQDKENSQFSSTKREYFDQFVFVDNLTNRSIAIRQIRKCKSNPNKVKCHKPRFSQQQQKRQLDECISLLRKANAFRKQNLKGKLFGSISSRNLNQNKNNEKEQIAKKKRLIRSMLADGITKRNKEELKQYLSSSSHKPDQELLKLARRQNYPISKKKVKEIVVAFQKKESGLDFRKNAFQNNLQDAMAKKLDLLSSQIQVQLRQKLRKTGQFLIEPKKCFLPIKNIRSYKLPLELNFFNTEEKTLQQLKWRQASLQNSQLTSNPKKVKWISGKINQQNRNFQAFDIMSKGNVEDVQIAFGKHGIEMAKSRDNEGNNLLHHAARLNKPLIFEYLLKIRGIQGLLEKNFEGDTPIEVACRLEYMEILKFVPHSLI